MSVSYRRDLTAADHDAIRRRQALTLGIDHLQRAANALQAARVGNNDGLRDAVLSDARRRLCSMQRELQALE